MVNFGAARCNDCPLKPRCAPYPGGRKLTIARREDLLQAGRAALQDADTEEHLRRTRPRIERLIGLLANRYGARKNRYIGSAKGDYRPTGPPRWSTSTRSATASTHKPHDGPEIAPTEHEPLTSLLHPPATSTTIRSLPCEARAPANQEHHFFRGWSQGVGAPPDRPVGLVGCRPSERWW